MEWMAWMGCPEPMDLYMPQVPASNTLATAFATYRTAEGRSQQQENTFYVKENRFFI
jgi:hypothetical protein